MPTLSLNHDIAITDSEQAVKFIEALEKAEAMNKMERLTFEGNFCDIAKCEDTPGGSFCEYGYCDQRRVWERLKEYEDIGTVEKFAELAQAESEGRLYIAPYKEGDTVYRINTNKRDQRYGVHEEKVTAVDVTVYVNGIIRPLEDLLPDREAAEAALAAKEERE